MLTEKLNSLIDHTLLKPTATAEDFKRLCHEASGNQFFSVCVPPIWVPTCVRLLKGSEVKVVTVIGFPFGYQTTRIKELEASIAVSQGADEVDMVMNLSAFKSKDYLLVEADIRAVVLASHNRPVKVIIESSELNHEEIVLACQIAERAKAQFVKTSTGFAAGGATAEAVKWMRETVGARLGVKASGGISSKDAATAMLRAGANRLGCSRSVEIVRDEVPKTESPKRNGGY